MAANPLERWVWSSHNDSAEFEVFLDEHAGAGDAYFDATALHDYESPGTNSTSLDSALLQIEDNFVLPSINEELQKPALEETSKLGGNIADGWIWQGQRPMDSSEFLEILDYTTAGVKTLNPENPPGTYNERTRDVPLTNSTISSVTNISTITHEINTGRWTPTDPHVHKGTISGWGPTPWVWGNGTERNSTGTDDGDSIIDLLHDDPSPVLGHDRLPTASSEGVEFPTFSASGPSIASIGVSTWKNEGDSYPFSTTTPFTTMLSTNSTSTPWRWYSYSTRLTPPPTSTDQQVTSSLSVAQFANSSLLAFASRTDSSDAAGEREEERLVIPEVATYVLVALLLAVFLVALTGHVLALLAIISRRYLRQSFFILYVSLSVSDLLINSFLVPTFVLGLLKDQSALRQEVCVLWSCVLPLVLFVSAGSIVGISAVRWWQFYNFEQTRSNQKIGIHLTVFGLWFGGFAMGLRAVVRSMTEVRSCSFHYLTNILKGSILIAYLVLVISMVVVGIVNYLTIRKIQQKTIYTHNRNGHNKGVLKQFSNRLWDSLQRPKGCSRELSNSKCPETPNFFVGQYGVGTTTDFEEDLIFCRKFKSHRGAAESKDLQGPLQDHEGPKNVQFTSNFQHTVSIDPLGPKSAKLPFAGNQVPLEFSTDGASGQMSMTKPNAPVFKGPRELLETLDKDVEMDIEKQELGPPTGPTDTQEDIFSPERKDVQDPNSTQFPETTFILPNEVDEVKRSANPLLHLTTLVDVTPPIHHRVKAAMWSTPPPQAIRLPSLPKLSNRTEIVQVHQADHSSPEVRLHDPWPILRSVTLRDNVHSEMPPVEEIDKTAATKLPLETQPTSCGVRSTSATSSQLSVSKRGSNSSSKDSPQQMSRFHDLQGKINTGYLADHSTPPSRQPSPNNNKMGKQQLAARIFILNRIKDAARDARRQQPGERRHKGGTEPNVSDEPQEIPTSKSAPLRRASQTCAITCTSKLKRSHRYSMPIIPVFSDTGELLDDHGSQLLHPIRRKCVCTSVRLMAFFAVLYTPLLVLHTVVYVIDGPTVLSLAVFVCFLLQTALNPFLYSFQNPLLKNAIRKTTKTLLCSRHRRGNGPPYSLEKNKTKAATLLISGWVKGSRNSEV